MVTRDNSQGRLRLTSRGKIVIATVVFMITGAGATMSAGYVINAQQNQLQKSNQIIRQMQDSQVKANIAEDDGPQDGSTDCWTLEMCGSN
jgi:hypothetical protein